MSELLFTTARDGGSASTAGSGTGAPAELRARARIIRRVAQYAQGQARQDELDEARKLERRAYELEQQLPDGVRP